MSQTTPAEQIVEQYERREVADHPFFVALRERPVNHSALWILLANLQIGISANFIVWLARAIEVIEDRRIASLIAKQLNDELGNGEFAEIHSVLLERFVRSLEPWRPANADAVTLRPGRTLREAENGLFGGDGYTMVGALMTGEIFAKKMDRCLGDEVRRQNQIEFAALRWLTLHETLEVNHADDSLELAKLVPRREHELAAATRGATEHWDILWRFLDDVHEQVARSTQSA
jgi:pyrroloquinoline quinone (PQQ) biosynthesis protein C